MKKKVNNAERLQGMFTFMFTLILVVLIGSLITELIYKTFGVVDIIAYMESIENDMPAMFGFLGAELICMGLAYMIIDLIKDGIMFLISTTKPKHETVVKEYAIRKEESQDENQ